MRIAPLAAAVLLSALPCFAQSELPPSWSTSQGDAPPARGSATATAAKAPKSQPRSLDRGPEQASAARYARGQMIDISAPLSPGVTPVYEGNPPIEFTFTKDLNKGDALDLSLYSMGSHTGTHVDAPLHFLKGGATIDQVPLPQLVGPARVIDVDPRVTAITASVLNMYKWRDAKRILFRTRNSDNNWIVDPTFHRDFVYIAPDAAQLMADAGVELVGIDYLSIEQFGVPVAQAHINLLRRGCVIAEGLDLRRVEAGDYMLTILPLKILGHEAAPARAMLQVMK